MTTKTSPETENQSPSTKSSGRPLLAWPIALVALTLSLLLIANTVSAWGRRDNADAAEMKEHVEFFVGRMLSKLDATDDQELRIQTLVGETVDQLAASHGERSEIREEIAAILTADEIDRAAIETLRATHLARADEMSQIVSQGLANVMDELTLDQRKELHERLERKHDRHSRWH